MILWFERGLQAETCHARSGRRYIFGTPFHSARVWFGFDFGWFAYVSIIIIFHIHERSKVKDRSVAGSAVCGSGLNGTNYKGQSGDQSDWGTDR